MNRKRDCAAVIPCFNESGTIAQLVRAVRNVLPAVIVVDDGSTDGTSTEAALGGAEVLRHTRNRGKGAALESGFEHARSRGFTHVLTLDGDGQHHPEDLPTLLARADESRADLVIGNRLVAPEAMPWLRRCVNRWMSRRLSTLAGVPLSDSQCGLRVVNLDAWSKLQLKTAHFEFESELLVEFVKAGHKVAFVPVRVIYNSRGSHIRPLLDGWRWLRWWFGQLRRKNSQHPVLRVGFLRRFSGLQHNSGSVRQLYFRVAPSGFKGKPVQFRPAKPAFD